ncbi:AraC family transcriptional regulator [Duganella sp. Leaf126]|nr:AraC family transcriptional regulator [Duganella sp. Leaf126]
MLIVDDEQDELRVLTDLLRRQLYHVRSAADGAAGYQSALAHPPDLILLDVRMPVVDGFAACRLLKADPVTRDIPVLFLSALDDPDERVAGLAMGGVDFITKPYHPAEVFARVRIHLELAAVRAAAAVAVVAAAAAGSAASATADAAAGTAATAVTPAPAQPTGSDHPARRFHPHPDAVMTDAAMRLIDDNLGAPLTLAGIARALGTYEKRLSQAFRQQAGITVFVYLAEARMMRGRQLLVDTDMSVQQIAEQIGFRSAANFATAFREHAGTTPTAYRQSVRQAVGHS